MPTIRKIFPQLRTISHPVPPLQTHEHLGHNMIAFREITTFSSKTMIAFSGKTPTFTPSIPTETRKNHENFARTSLP